MTENAQLADNGILIEPPSPARRILSWIGWLSVGFFFLLFFTILKLPEDRLKNYIQGNISAALAPRGISLTAGTSKISMGFGISYVMKDVTIHFPPPDSPSHVDEISVSPSILPMILGRFGGSLDIRNGDGRLSGSFSIKGTSFNGSFKAKSLDLGKIGILELASGIKGTATLNGSGSFNGDPSNFATAAIDLDLDILKLVLDQQAIPGAISIPRIAISEGKITAATEKGRLAIKKFQLGKPGNPADDLHATASGDLTLGRTLDSSTMNVKAVFSISPTILKSLFLIDALLAPGKQPDGTYSFRLQGPVGALNPIPEPP